MKNILVIIAIAAFLMISCDKFKPQAKELKKEDLKTQTDKISYSIGFDMAKNFKQREMEIKLDVFTQGFKDGLAGKEGLMTEQEFKDVMTAFQQEMMQKQMEKMKKDAEENKKIGAKFLEENKKKEGIIALENGLQYKVIKEGTGASPKPEDTVKVNYIGTLIDGKEFDSSVKRGQPAEFQLNRVIKGWTEGLQKMKVGGKTMFYIPSDLAYGDRGAGPDIKAGSTLIFDVELLEVKPAPAETKEGAAAEKKEPKKEAKKK